MEFEEFLNKKGFVKKTISRHQREVLKYNEYLKSCDLSIDSATKKNLLDYLLYSKENRQLANITQNQILQILKNYYKYLKAYYGIKNIAISIKIRGVVKQRLQKLFTQDDLELLCDTYLKFTEKYKPTEKQTRYNVNFETILQSNYIALSLLCNQGLQISELLNLDKTDFDFRKGKLYLSQSRKSNKRILDLEVFQLVPLMEFFNENKVLLKNLNQLERLSKTLKKLSPIFKDFRQLRASRIVFWIKDKGIRKAQYFAGHKSITSTEKYLNNDFQLLQDSLETFHPLGK